MKLLHVMAGAPTGGAENIFLESVLALADAPYAQAVVTRPNNDVRIERFRARGIEVSTASFDPLLRWRTSGVIEDVVRRFQPDVIQYWMGRAGTFATKRSIAQVGWYGGYYALKRFRHCDAHVALTEDIARHIVNEGAKPDEVAIIRTFADFEPVAPTPRAGLDTPENAPVLLALARLHWKKGLDILLKALPALPGAYAWIAGDGPLKDELIALAAKEGVADRVRFLGWRDDRAALLAAANVCVFPSRYEPFGTVVVDAWAAGVPLVTAKAKGPAATVTHNGDGLLVEIDDIAGLTAAIKRVLQEPGLSDKLVAGGQRTYQAKFTKAVFLADSRAFYTKLAAAKAEAPVRFAALRVL